METIKLRPHHVSRIIDHYKGIINIKDALMASKNYSKNTIDEIIKLVEFSINNPSQKIRIIGNDNVGEDNICARCDNNYDGKCTLPDSEEINPGDSTDQREALRYGLQPGVYTLKSLLKREQAFHPKTII